VEWRQADQEHFITSHHCRDRAPVHSGGLAASLLPIAALVGVALTWGVAFVMVKHLVVQIPRAVLVAWRFSRAATLVDRPSRWPPSGLP
jgi:hypothetical protein